MRQRGGGSLGSAVVALTGARVAAAGAQFLAGIVAARLLSPDDVGVSGAALTVGWVVAIVANGGLNIAAIYFLGRRRAERAMLVRRFVGLGLGAVAVAALITALCAPVVGAAVIGAQRPLLFVAAAVLATATVGYELAGALLLGLERRTPYILADVFRSAGTLLVTAGVLVLLWRTAEGYVLATGLGVLVSAVFALSVVRREVGSLRPRSDREFSKQALRMGLAGQLGNVLTFVNLRLDLLLVPALLRLDAAGIYFVATRVSEVVGQASNAAASMLFPHVAAQQDRNATQMTERTSRLTLLATLAVAVVLGALAGPLLGLFFGSAYRAGWLALSILLVAMLPLALTRVLAADLKGRGRPGLVSIGTGAGAVLTVIADVALIPPFGIEGAAVASVLAYTGSAGVLGWWYHRETGGRLRALLPRPRDVVDVIAWVRARLRRTGESADTDDRPGTGDTVRAAGAGRIEDEGEVEDEEPPSPSSTASSPSVRRTDEAEQS